MIFNIILTIICVITLAYAINTFNIENKNNKSKISFKESFDLLNVPIITFTYNNRKLHFLFDTGSSLSHIRPELIKSLKLKKQKTESSGSIAANGVINFNGICSIPLGYKEEKYNADFMITEGITASLDTIKQDFNIEVHGILGCDFFNKYNYVIDFKEAVIYSKK